MKSLDRLRSALEGCFVPAVTLVAWALLHPHGVSASVGMTVSVPEPASALLIATGVAGIALEARRRSKK